MALNATLAPFAAPEKPDLCPRSGAGFSKDAIAYTRGDVCQPRPPHRTQPESEVSPFGIFLILLNFFAERDQASHTKRRQKHI